MRQCRQRVEHRCVHPQENFFLLAAYGVLAASWGLFLVAGEVDSSFCSAALHLCLRKRQRDGENKKGPTLSTVLRTDLLIYQQCTVTAAGKFPRPWVFGKGVLTCACSKSDYHLCLAVVKVSPGIFRYS